ncbi:hypothetical protein AVEN_124698-1 [Araneus ventricosus]|uniref:Uncharacterized protein n=1 Tax=Araneus ventricosus TaxID=182803 RepID=A0A4Y2FXK0_ARAVE|nr:hypothetical protein AVEN_7183-1 [Araneus ventricosus]GBM44404.1 hypothetical protein AVEN_231890-1 [Araneus ventricosus]GBM44422.1 hypothetical protein AVEN_90970-1 [Araneus ventricosus]GBM44435.1 hypothetical protein AVEN_124698-1 [Araneus ventricosus]
MLCVKFQNEGFVVKQAEEYVDYLIIKSALEIEKRSQCVVVVGEDIDLLVITAASTNSQNIFFLKPGRGQGCTNSLEDSIITNLANQEAEIDIRMEEIILEVDLEEEYQKVQVEESDSKQIDINDYD